MLLARHRTVLVSLRSLRQLGAVSARPLDERSQRDRGGRALPMRGGRRDSCHHSADVLSLSSAATGGGFVGRGPDGKLLSASRDDAGRPFEDDVAAEQYG